MGIGVPEERVATPIMRERQRVQRVVENLANRLGLQAGHRVQRAFRPDEAGRIASLPGRPTVQDLAARLPEFELNAEQQKTMQWLRQEFEKYGAAYKEVFGEPIGPRPDIVEGGFYLPRGRAAMEGADEPLARVVVGGGRRGTKIGAERHAVFASQAEGIEAGYRYASFAEAAHSFAKTMGDRVLEEHTSNLFKQAIDEAGQLLGETQAARLLRQNPLLKEAVGGLRQRVSGLARRIDNTYRSLKLAGMEERRIFTRLQRLEEQAAGMMAAAGEAEKSELVGIMRDIRVVEGKMNILRQLARSPTGRKARLTAKLAGLEVKYGETQADLSDLIPKWQKALDKARQLPRGTGSIGFYPLQGMSFPDAVANAANKYLAAEGMARGAGAGALNVIGAVNGLLRGVRATADASFIGIQGLLGLVHKPMAYQRALRVAVRAVGDKDSLSRFLVEFDEKAVAEGLPTSAEWIKAGLRMGGADTEFMIGGSGVGRIGSAIAGAPVIRQSNRAFGYFGDTLRLDAAQGMLRATGEKDMASLARAANLMTGWSEGRFLGDVGNLVQFAPRFFQSQLELVARAAMDGSMTGDQARRMLLKLVGVGTLMTVAANEAQGTRDFDYLTPLRDGRLNPNFMRIRFQGQDISLFGPWDSLLRAAVSASQGDFGYVARSKASPLISMSWDLISGKTFMGEEVTVETFLRSQLPFSLGEVGQESPMATAIGMTGVKAAPVTTTEKLDALTQERFGKDFWELSPLKGVDREQYRELVDFWQKVEEYQDQQSQTRGRPSEVTAINIVAEREGKSRLFTLQALRLRQGTKTRREATDMRYWRFLAQYQEQIEQAYPWLYKNPSEELNTAIRMYGQFGEK